MNSHSAETPPSVSVVIPTHNRAGLLQRSIASVLAQTFADFELIVVDDGSTDDTPALLASIQDPRMRVFRNETGGGAAAARNRGIAAARAPLLAFHDDDDVWLLHKLERQVEALRARPDVAWCLGSYLSVSPQGVCYYGGAFYRDEIDYRRGIGSGGPEWYLIATPNWLVRTDVLRRLGGFDERIHSWDDWELSLRIRQETDFVHVDEPLWIQDRIEGGGLTRAERARGDDMRIILQKHGAMWHNNRRVLARHYYVIGRSESLYDSSRGAGRDMLWKACRIRPYGLQAWLALLLSLLDPETIRSITVRLRAWREARRG